MARCRRGKDRTVRFGYCRSCFRHGPGTHATVTRAGDPCYFSWAAGGSRICETVLTNSGWSTNSITAGLLSNRIAL